jgi:hypothetical protein
MPGIDFLWAALTPFHIAIALGGVIAGTVIRSLPGLTAIMAIAVLVPITFSMEPASALILMGANPSGSNYRATSHAAHNRWLPRSLDRPAWSWKNAQLSDRGMRFSNFCIATNALISDGETGVP